MFALSAALPVILCFLILYWDFHFSINEGACINLDAYVVVCEYGA